MKRMILILTVALVAGFAVGCTSANNNTGTWDYDHAHKTQFVDNLTKELDAMQTELDALAASIDGSDQALEEDVASHLQAFHENLLVARRKVRQAQIAPEPTWDDAKDNTKEALEGLKDSFDTTRRWLSDQAGS